MKNWLHFFGKGRMNRQEQVPRRNELEKKAWYRFFKLCYGFGYIVSLVVAVAIGYSEFPVEYVDSDISIIRCANGKEYSARAISGYFVNNQLDSYDDEKARKLCEPNYKTVEVRLSDGRVVEIEIPEGADPKVAIPHAVKAIEADLRQRDYTLKANPSIPFAIPGSSIEPNPGQRNIDIERLISQFTPEMQWQIPTYASPQERLEHLQRLIRQGAERLPQIGREMALRQQILGIPDKEDLQGATMERAFGVPQGNTKLPKHLQQLEAEMELKQKFKSGEQLDLWEQTNNYTFIPVKAVRGGYATLLWGLGIVIILGELIRGSFLYVVAGRPFFTFRRSKS